MHDMVSQVVRLVESAHTHICCDVCCTGLCGSAKSVELDCYNGFVTCGRMGKSTVEACMVVCLAESAHSTCSYGGEWSVIGGPATTACSPPGHCTPAAPGEPVWPLPQATGGPATGPSGGQ